MDIPTPNAAALEMTEFLLPYIGMVMIVIIGFMIKDFATKFSKGLAFQMNNQFQEGDHVLIDGGMTTLRTWLSSKGNEL